MNLNKSNLRFVFFLTGTIAMALFIVGIEKVGHLALDERMRLFGIILCLVFMNQAWTSFDAGFETTPQMKKLTTWRKMLPRVLVITALTIPLAVTVILAVILNVT